VNEGFLPIISQIPGFVALYLVDAGGGVMISTSFFEDQSGAEDRRAYPKVHSAGASGRRSKVKSDGLIL
jgi:hypothetical protein